MGTAPDGTPGNPETREETIERIAEDDLRVRAATTAKDPSTRRHLGRRMAIAGSIGILLGGIVFLLVWLLADNWKMAIALWGVTIVVCAALAPIFVAEGDDEEVDVGRDRGATGEKPRSQAQRDVR